MNTIHINEHAEYFVDTGCVRIGDSTVIELTVREEELLELLLQTPKITVPYSRIEEELAVSTQTLRHYLKGLRVKLGTRAIRTHHHRGISLQPHLVGTAHLAILRRAAS